MDTRAADEAAIRAASQEWSKAATSRDLEKAVSPYAEDASYFPAGGTVASGKDAIRKAWTQILAPPGRALSWTATKVEVARSGDLAYETGSYEITEPDNQGQSTARKGKYVVVWKKQADGGWKVVADIDNPDQWPAPPAQARRAKHRAPTHGAKRRRHGGR